MWQVNEELANKVGGKKQATKACSSNRCWDRSEWFWVQTFTWHVGPTVHLLLLFWNVPSDLPQKTLVNEKQKRKSMEKQGFVPQNRGLIFFIGLIWHDRLSLALVSPGSWTHRAAQSDATDGAREYAFGEWHPVELLCRLYNQVWFCVKIILSFCASLEDQIGIYDKVQPLYTTGWNSTFNSEFGFHGIIPWPKELVQAKEPRTWPGEGVRYREMCWIFPWHVNVIPDRRGFGLG